MAEMASKSDISWIYVAACLVIPAVWGLCCAWLFGRIDSRRSSVLPEQPVDP